MKHRRQVSPTDEQLVCMDAPELRQLVRRYRDTRDFWQDIAVSGWLSAALALAFLLVAYCTR